MEPHQSTQDALKVQSVPKTKRCSTTKTMEVIKEKAEEEISEDEKPGNEQQAVQPNAERHHSVV